MTDWCDIDISLTMKVCDLDLKVSEEVGGGGLMEQCKILD